MGTPDSAVGDTAPVGVFRSVFDAAAREYDAARPSYPGALFDALERQAGPLAGRIVLDWGAGTGIASRQLAARGARVVCLDIGEQMLRRAKMRDPRAECVLADGCQMPVRAASADLTTFAQSWHWFRLPAAGTEVARVLKPGGYWAAWWNQAQAGGQPWFDSYRSLMARSCPGYLSQRHGEEAIPDWTQAEVAASGRLEALGVAVLPWTRRVSAADWITDQRSRSYLIALDPAARQAVLDQLTAIVADEFPDGQMVVPHVTRLLLARKAD